MAIPPLRDRIHLPAVPPTVVADSHVATLHVDGQRNEAPEALEASVPSIRARQ